jgi:hypothetical protein
LDPFNSDITRGKNEKKSTHHHLSWCVFSFT